MTDVGVEELQQSLGRYLQRVREGEILRVTDRGEPVATISPIGASDPIAERIVGDHEDSTAEAFRMPPAPVELRPGPPVAAYVSEGRD